MKYLSIFLLLIFSNSAHADLKNSFLELAGGYTFDTSIVNPDNSVAYYDGIAFKAQFHYNLSQNRAELNYGLTAHYKFLNVDNTKESATLKESAIHRGVGAGVFIKSDAFYLGVNYSLMEAEHQTTGTVFALDNFNYNPITVDVAYTIPHGTTMELGFGYSYSFTDLSKQETGLTKDSPYKEHMAWFKLLFYFNRF